MKKIEDYLTENFGYDETKKEIWMPKINEWRSWYRGYNALFHSYQVYTGKSRVSVRRKSMQMAKKCCEDWADILFNSNCKIELRDSESSAKELNEVLEKNNFWLLVNQTIEKAFALGTGGLVLSVKNFQYNETTGAIKVSGAEPQLEFIDVEKIFPISWDNSKVTECAFVSYKTIHGQTYAVLSVHYIQTNGNYAIHNRIFRVNQTGGIEELDKGTEVSMLGAESDFNTMSSKKWFVLLSPAIANNVIISDEKDLASPFGLSIFANSIDCLKAIDESFDSLSNELVLGRKRIFVSENLMEHIDGQKSFDASDTSVYTLPSGLNQENLFQPENSPLRVNEIVTALTSDLSAFSNSVGMGRQMYDFGITNMSTAAQVYSTNSELKRKRDKHLTKVENELFDLLDAICYVASTFSHYSINPEGLSIIFDDNIFEDLDTVAKRTMLEVDAGVLAPYEYREKVFKENVTTAKEKIQEIQKENQLLITNEDDA